MSSAQSGNDSCPQASKAWKSERAEARPEQEQEQRGSGEGHCHQGVLTVPLSPSQDPTLSLLVLAMVEDPAAQGFQSDHVPSEPTSLSFPFYKRQALCLV